MCLTLYSPWTIQMLVRLDISGCYIISESLARTVFAKLLLVVSVNIDADLKRKKTEQQWKNEVGSTGKNTDIWHHHTHTHTPHEWLWNQWGWLSTGENGYGGLDITSGVCKRWERFDTQHLTIQSVGETNRTNLSGIWATVRLVEIQTNSWKCLSGDAFGAEQ